jgi:hypothetical protein
MAQRPVNQAAKGFRKWPVCINSVRRPCSEKRLGWQILLGVGGRIIVVVIWNTAAWPAANAGTI